LEANNKYKLELTKYMELCAKEEEILADLEQQIKDITTKIEENFQKNNLKFARLFSSSTNEVVFEKLSYVMLTYHPGCAYYSLIHNVDSMGICKDSCHCKTKGAVLSIPVRLTMDVMRDFVQCGKASYIILTSNKGELRVVMTIDPNDSLPKKDGYNLKVVEKVEIFLSPKKLLM
jgi:hypothetical protein